MEPPFVVHVVVEVKVHSRGRVIDEEPARLGQFEALAVLIHDHRTDAERCLHQHLHGIN